VAVGGESAAARAHCEAHDGWVRCLTTSPDGQYLLSGGNDRLVKLWNIADGTLVREFAGHDSHVYSLAFHSSGQFALSGDLRGNVHQWDVAAGKLVRSFDAKALWSYNGGQGVDFGGVRALAVSADGKWLAAGGLFNASNPRPSRSARCCWLGLAKTAAAYRRGAEGLSGGCVSSRRLADRANGGNSGGQVLFWKPEQNKEFHRYALPNTIRDLDLHPDNIRIVTSHHDRHLRISQLTPKA
jgi:WD40 repeat protein